MVHLTHDLNPATHRLIANEFLPDLPDNPYKRGWKEEYYSTTDWIYVENVSFFIFLYLGESRLGKLYLDPGPWPQPGRC